MKTIKKLCLCCGKEFDARLSEIKKGYANYCTRRCSAKLVSIFHKGNQISKGCVPWNKGKPWSEDIKNKLKSNHADFNGKNNPLWGTLGSMFGKKHTPETIKKLCGNKNHNWKGGISFEPYCDRFNERLKRRVRERDNNLCQLCKCTEQENGRNLAVHHIHYDKKNCYPDLIALCSICSSKANFDRKYYEALFMNKLNSRGLLFWTKIID